MPKHTYKFLISEASLRRFHKTAEMFHQRNVGVCIERSLWKFKGGGEEVQEYVYCAACAATHNGHYNTPEKFIKAHGGKLL